MLELTREELLSELSSGRELEFHLNECAYFIGRKDEQDFYLWDENAQITLCCGTMEEIFSFPFPTGKTLNDNIESFSLDYLL